MVAVNSYERVVTGSRQILDIQHKYSALVGSTFDMVEWEEKYSEGSVHYSTAVMKVEGILSLDVIGGVRINNYCTVGIGADSLFRRSSL